LGIYTGMARPAGSKNKRTLFREAQKKAAQAEARLAAAKGNEYALADSLSVMDEAMKFFLRLAREEKKGAVKTKGDYYIAAVSIAEKMAPYRHPRLSSVRVGGDQSHPILVQDGVTAQQVLAEMMAQIIESGVVPTQIAGMLEAPRSVAARGINSGDHRCEATLLKPK
jgi:hypothetical protein